MCSSLFKLQNDEISDSKTKVVEIGQLETNPDKENKGRKHRWIYRTIQELTDVFTKEKRSWVMSRIRGKGTKPEAFVERLLINAGAAYEKHPNMVGRPDFVLAERKIIIFADGDFWHGYRMGPKKLATMEEFWRVKISGNKARDRKVNAMLRKEGWAVIRIWEHDIMGRPDYVSAKILERLLRP